MALLRVVCTLLAVCGAVHVAGALSEAGVSASGDLQLGDSGFNRDKIQFWAPEYKFGLVADLDHASRDPHDFVWRSVLKTGFLTRTPDNKFDVRWDAERAIEATTARNNRSMELSELVRYRHLLLAMCDVTGLVFKILPDGRVFQRWAIADGDGEKPRPFKTEWATVKDGLLWVGSIGKEWNLPDGSILNRNAEWVKTIDANGRIDNHDWGMVYNALRSASNNTQPGYVWHEAVHWDPYLRKWLFLPRKASVNIPYDPERDESLGTNLLYVCSEDFSEISVRTVGPVEPEYGFSALRRIPGSNGLYMALKSKEVAAVTHTKLVVFDIEGNLLSDWIHVDSLKYEGLEFVYGHPEWAPL